MKASDLALYSAVAIVGYGTLAFFCSVHAESASPFTVPSAVNEVLRSPSPAVDGVPKASGDLKHGEVAMQAIGDLNGDGLNDWAGLVYNKAQVGEWSSNDTFQVQVMFQNKDGSYRLSEKTKERLVNCGMSACGIERIDIKRGSLFISFSLMGHGCIDDARHQFKFIDDQWRLIGTHYRQVDMSVIVPLDKSGGIKDEPKEGYQRNEQVADIDHNLVTGETTILQKNGKAKAQIKRVELPRTTWLLKDYEDGYQYGLPKVSAIPWLCGR
jgi:hypothetical protein